ncbi:hypothetical protein ACP275_14G166100 [Erythranthe tilingii]
MVSPSKRVAQLAAVKMEACTTENAPENEEIRHTRFGSSSEAAKLDEDEIRYLSGKPYFDVVLSKSHISPTFGLLFPASMIRELPRATVPAVLKNGGKTWNMSYCGGGVRPKLDSRWKTFVADNNLKIGDGCVFELMESTGTNLVFKVMIVRGDIPTELQELIDSRGKSGNTPIVLD